MALIISTFLSALWLIFLRFLTDPTWISHLNDLKPAKSRGRKVIILVCLQSGISFLEDEALPWKLIHAIRDDVQWFFGNRGQRLLEVNVLLLDQTGLLRQWEIDLQRYQDAELLELTTTAEDPSGLREPLKKRLSQQGAAPVLVTVQFEKQTDDLNQIRRAAIDLVSIDDRSAIHYALATGGNYREYLDERSNAPPRLIRTDGYDDVEVFNYGRERATPFPGGPVETRASDRSNSGAGSLPSRFNPGGTDQDTLITRFEGIYDIQLRFGAAPCHVYHMTDGRCKHVECTHLHDEIQFTPSAHAQYRAFLSKRLCPHGKTCKHQTTGTCFYDHECPGYATCTKTDCPYEHRHPVQANRPFETTREFFNDWFEADRENWRQKMRPSFSGYDRDDGGPYRASRGFSRPRRKFNQSSNPNLIQPTWRDWTPTSTELSDFLPLIRAISTTCSERGSHKVHRSLVGTLIKCHHTYPLGHGKYKDFYAYTHAAMALGYVVLTGSLWIQSTGILEHSVIEDASDVTIFEAELQDLKYLFT